MMFLTEVKLVDIVKKQFMYKIKAYLSVFSSLLTIQIIGILLSTTGSRSMGTSSNGFSLNVSYYTGDIIIIFTMIWALISAIIITTKAYRNDDFVFVSNRLSSNLSNIVFLLFASIVGGITTMLSGILFKVIMYFILDDGNVATTFISIQELIVGIIASILYVFLLASLGYFVGMLVQLSKWFTIILPAVFLGYLFLGGNRNGEPTFLLEIGKFFIDEASLLVFFLKVIAAGSFLFYVSIILSNKIEVRQ
ncbi:hypothetical protein [Metabacillus bambusae]|uniref:ABC transporter permease n=1 Tax=Metabacillus bambusae TaxID=2795218 RepID=A0ABS3N443_9BACI|nr:hypothetical protein [Metabacillus bambusae]MBO1512915.1 hypothetical protein [Metabacillus bambusae]